MKSITEKVFYSVSKGLVDSSPVFDQVVVSVEKKTKRPNGNKFERFKRNKLFVFVDFFLESPDLDYILSRIRFATDEQLKSI